MLRNWLICIILAQYTGYYPLSIITRIETSHKLGVKGYIDLLLSPFHYNKD